MLCMIFFFVILILKKLFVLFNFVNFINKGLLIFFDVLFIFLIKEIFVNLFLFKSKFLYVEFFLILIVLDIIFKVGLWFFFFFVLDIFLVNFEKYFINVDLIIV